MNSTPSEPRSLDIAIVNSDEDIAPQIQHYIERANLRANIILFSDHEEKFAHLLKTQNIDLLIVDADGDPTITAEILEAKRRATDDILVVAVTSGSFDEVDPSLEKVQLFDVVPKDELLRLGLVVKRVASLIKAKTNASALRNDLHLWSDIANTLPLGIMLADEHGAPQFVNSAFENLTGYTFTEILKSKKPSRVCTINLSTKGIEDENLKFDKQCSDITLRNKRGSLVPLRVAEYKLGKRSDDKLRYMKTIEVRTEDELNRYVTSSGQYDELTKLPQRQVLIDRLSHYIAASKRSENKVAVFFIDVDSFKQLNDDHGHAVGDTVLVNIAQRLVESLRKSSTVARISGDEFVVAVPDIENIVQLELLAERLLQSFHHPIVHENEPFYVTASIGIALYPDDASASPAALLSYADMAMYKAKREGRNTYRFYDSSLSNQSEKRLSVNSQVASAFEHDQIHINFLPIFSSKDMALSGVHILPMINADKYGEVNVQNHLSSLNRNGRLSAYIDWMVDDLTRCIDPWVNARSGNFTISLDMSLPMLRQEGVVAKLSNLLFARNKNVDVELVLPAEVFSQNALVTDFLFELFDMGFQLGTNGFGVSDGMLKTLATYPISSARLSSALLPLEGSMGAQKRLLQALVHFLREMNITSVTHSVENQKQLAFLSAAGCDLLGGPALVKPMLENKIDEFVNSWEGKSADLSSHIIQR